MDQAPRERGDDGGDGERASEVGEGHSGTRSTKFQPAARASASLRYSFHGARSVSRARPLGLYTSLFFENGDLALARGS